MSIQIGLWARLKELAASTGAGLVGFIQAGAGAVARTMLSKQRDMLCVLDFGVVGDGVTDDAAYIQAAIDAASGNGGGTVFFPKSTYLIGGTLQMRSNVNLQGQRGAKIKLKAGSVGALANGSMLYALQQTDIEVSGLELDGNKANNDINDNYGNGINFHDCQRVRVSGCYIHDVPRDGITVSRLIGGNGNEDVHIHDNTVIGSGAASQTTGGEGIIVVEGEWISIRGNICRNNKYRGIEIETIGTTIVNWSVIGNVCDGNAYAGIGVNGATDGAVVGNIVTDNAGYGIRINSSVQVVGNVTVSGNKASGNGVNIAVENYRHVVVIGNAVFGGTTGIFATNVREWQCIGNAVSGALNHGIDFSAGANQDVVVSGNFVRACNQSLGGYDNVTGNSTYALIEGNRISASSADYGLDITGGSGFAVLSNIMDNSGSAGAIRDASAGAKIRNNAGYITEKSGSSSIVSGSTSVVVNHGLSVTPSAQHITVTATNDPSNAVGTIWVDTLTGTQFTVHVENNPGASNLNFGWKAQVV